MKTKSLLLSVLICFIIGTAFFINVLFTENISPEPDLPMRIKEPLTDSVNHLEKESEKLKIKSIVDSKPVIQPDIRVETNVEPEAEEEIETIESLKEKISDIAVEYIEDISLLDELVQESASEPEELWEGEWVSIDDWKRKKDSFSVEKNEDGEFELIPEKDSIESFSYNEETKEFQWELDYYGKKIIHKARFISEDVMVRMKISGIKVHLDIYKRDAG